MRDYASIAIIDTPNSENVAIEVISITKESCDLAGAWILKKSDTSTIKEILVDRLILKLNVTTDMSETLKTFDKFQINLNDFLIEARTSVLLAEKLFSDFVRKNEVEYKAFMAIKPVERKLLTPVKKKKLVQPDFSKWPVELDILKADVFLKSINKKALLVSNHSEMSGVLIAARVTKILIDNWRYDETERLNKIYVAGEDAAVSVLPLCWLEKFTA